MILVTGCAGFIGSHLSERLLSSGHEVIGIDNFDPFYDKELKLKNLQYLLKYPGFHFIEGDICDETTWENASGKTIDTVIHLAAKAGVLPSLQHPDQYIRTNIHGTYKVLEFMQQEGIRNLLFASSSSVYGNNKKLPFSEEDNVDHPISPYAFTKKSCELLIHNWHHLYNINAVCLRFFTVFGPRQRPDLAIRKFVSKIMRDEPIEMYGDGGTARDYTYIDDTVEGIMRALRFVRGGKKTYEIINLGNHEPVSLGELIETIYKVLDKTPNIIQVDMKPGDVLYTYADLSRAHTLLQYTPKTSLTQGIQKFVEWYQTND
jgi:UDP-glucuronate 4-epimerase